MNKFKKFLEFLNNDILFLKTVQYISVVMMILEIIAYHTSDKPIDHSFVIMYILTVIGINVIERLRKLEDKKEEKL